MCTVSAIMDYGQMRVPDHEWNTTNWPVFKQLVRQAEEFDKVAGQPDCIDPAKETWMKSIEARIEKLEAAAFRATP